MIERLANLIGALGQRLGLDEVRFTPEDLKRILVLVLVCVGTSLLVVDYARAPSDPLVEGDPAPRTVKAPFTFDYMDVVAHEAARTQAAESTRNVFQYRADLASELGDRVQRAFGAARTRIVTLVAEREIPADADLVEALDSGARRGVIEDFRAALGVHIPDVSVQVLLGAGFDEASEQLTRRLLARGMQDRILPDNDRDNLPSDGRGVTLITLEGGQATESVLKDLAELYDPDAARQQVQIALIDERGEPAILDAAATVARALVRPNVGFDPLKTEEARLDAVTSVSLELVRVKRGSMLFREGDTLTAEHIQKYAALQAHRGDTDLVWQVLAFSLLLLLLLLSLYYFGATYLQAFTTEVRDVAAVGMILVMMAMVARLVVASADFFATEIGFEIEANSVWFVVPVAAGAMLVRQLMGVGWTWLYAIAISVVCGLMMDLQVLPVVFFLISSVAAASAVEQIRERISVLRAGVYVGAVNAVCVLLLHFVELSLSEVDVSSATRLRPLWSMVFAFSGGWVSSVLVLGLIPAFEAVGFVTDYRLMELANMNHPLMRDLMFRAPGSYTHSVGVGTLAEAGCDRIGANSLRARVCAYFHDIGKTTKPAFFVENQRDGVNRHDGLDPHTSARIIIAHVTDGVRMAQEHRLPQPIIDNILMHHGTGLLAYFYMQAQEEAEDPSEVDEADFRYPGPKPNTREAGIVMLADKVEAATRTLKNPDEANIRALISRIVSSVIADGQFTECPLTFKDIHAVAESFVQVLLATYHQRIEYPDTRDLSQAESRPPTGDEASRGVITLELLPSVATDADENEGDEPAAVVQAPPQRAAALKAAVSADEEASDVVDYESIDHLPGD